MTISTRTRVRRALLTWAVGLGVFRLTLWAPEVCPPFAATQARVAATAAADWLVANQSPDGEYLYEWDRSSGTASDDYNLVRHAGVTMSLYQLVEAGEPRYQDAADAGLAWMLDRLEPVGDDALAFTDSSRAKLGAAALLVVSLAHRRLATGDRRHDVTMQALGRFMVGQQRPDGSMLNFFDVDRGRPVAGITSIYSTGEANWALAMLHEAFPAAGFDDAAWRTLDYVTDDRDTVEGYFPQPWPDQWAAYSLAEMVEWGLSDDHVDYARRLTERYGMMLRFDAQRGTSFGSITHGPSPRGAATGTWVEGIGSLQRLTVADPRLADIAEPVARTLACGASRLAERQVESGPGVPVTEAGAIFFDGDTRMDDQQHVASGLLLSEAVLP